MALRLARAVVLAAAVLAPAGARGSTTTAPAPAPAAPTIELYTMGVGDDWVERFGHSAMCVRQADPRRDRCYNYGTTSFDDLPALVWNFLRGSSTFWVSTSRPERLIDGYVALDRTIWVQRLPLAPPAARRLADLLAHDALPENRSYRYHHIDDNCTTRLRDFIDQVTGGALSRRTAGRYPTLRELTRRGWAEEPLLLQLSDVLVGRRVDRAPTPYQAMFLPIILRDEVAAVFGAPPEEIYARRGPPISQDPAGRWPYVVAFAVLALPVLLAVATGRFRRAAAIVALIPVALAGLLVWTLAIVSAVPEFRWNEAVLVLTPLDALLLFGPVRWRAPYARARLLGLGLVTLALAAGLLRQPLWLPILLAALGTGSQYLRPQHRRHVR